MNLDRIVAVVLHVHAEAPCRQPLDDVGCEFDEAADEYYGTVLNVGRRPAGWIEDFSTVGFKREAHPLILKENRDAVAGLSVTARPRPESR